MAIRIPFVAEVTDFLRGTRSVTDSLDDVADALDDIGQAGDDVNRQVSKDLDTVADTADDSADKIRKSFKEAFSAVEKQGRTSSRKVVDDVDDVGHRGSATLREFTDEAKQNVAESVSSFNGSASSAVDALQSTFGGLVTALGPAGVVGAAVVGVGIGLARGLFEKSKEAAQEVAEAVADLTDQFIELGRTDLGIEQVNEQLKEFATTAEDGSVQLDDIARAARDAGIDFRDYARGLAGDAESLNRSWAAVNTALQDNAAAKQAWIQTSQGDVLADEFQALLEEETALNKTRDALLAKDTTLDHSTSTYKLYQSAIEGSTEATDDDTEATVSNNDAKATQYRRLLGVKGALDGVTESAKTNGKSLDDNTEKGRANAGAVLDALDAIEDWGTAQVESGAKASTTSDKMAAQGRVLVEKVKKAFGLTTEQAQAYIEKLGGIPDVVATRTELEEDAVKNSKNVGNAIDYAARNRTATVTVDLEGVHETERELRRLTREQTVTVGTAAAAPTAAPVRARPKLGRMVPA